MGRILSCKCHAEHCEDPMPDLAAGLGCRRCAVHVLRTSVLSADEAARAYIAALDAERGPARPGAARPGHPPGVRARAASADHAAAEGGVPRAHPLPHRQHHVPVPYSSWSPHAEQGKDHPASLKAIQTPAPCIMEVLDLTVVALSGVHTCQGLDWCFGFDKVKRQHLPAPLPGEELHIVMCL